jgi:hypothetical protein
LWNSAIQTINAYGQWNYSVFTLANDGMNSTSSGSITFLQITEELNSSALRSGESLFVSGHINDSQWQDVADAEISIFLNGERLSNPYGFTDYASNLCDYGTGWDRYLRTPHVIKEGSTYKMWYSGSIGTHIQIGYATSPDGITWTNCGNPVLTVGTPPSYDSGIAQYPFVVKEKRRNKMWYSAYNMSVYQIAFANSTDGITWEKYAGNPVLTVGSSGTWEDSAVLTPKVVHDGSTYKMWYSGYDSTGTYKIGYATSTDGLTWEKYSGNPVLTEGSTYDSYYVANPFVIKEGGTLRCGIPALTLPQTRKSAI